MNIDTITSELMSMLKHNKMAYTLKPSKCGRFALRSFLLEGFQLNIFYDMKAGDNITLFEVNGYHKIIDMDYVCPVRLKIIDVCSYMSYNYPDISEIND